MKKLILLIGLSLPLIAFGQDSNINYSQTAQMSDSTPIQGEIFDEVAQFPGDLNAYLKKKIKYPITARKEEIEGVVTLSFQIDENGQVINVTVDKGLGYGCDEEGIRVLKAMPKWKPATKNGKPVLTYYKMNVNFILKNRKRFKL